MIAAGCLAGGLAGCASSSGPKDEGSYTLGGSASKREAAAGGDSSFSGSVGVYAGYSSTDFRDARRAAR